MSECPSARSKIDRQLHHKMLYHRCFPDNNLASGDWAFGPQRNRPGFIPTTVARVVGRRPMQAADQSDSRPAVLDRPFFPRCNRFRSVETARGVFQVREDEPAPRVGGGAPDPLKGGKTTSARRTMERCMSRRAWRHWPSQAGSASAGSCGPRSRYRDRCSTKSRC